MVCALYIMCSTESVFKIIMCKIPKVFTEVTFLGVNSQSLLLPCLPWILCSAHIHEKGTDFRDPTVFHLLEYN
jgi:hypothetical protein